MCNKIKDFCSNNPAASNHDPEIDRHKYNTKGFVNIKKDHHFVRLDLNCNNDV